MASIHLGSTLPGPSRLSRPRVIRSFCSPLATTQRRHLSFTPITDLAAVLASVPAPALAIIGTTFAVRLATTLPVTLWQRSRIRKAKELVAPEMKKVNEMLMISVMKESRRKGLDHIAYRKELKKQLAAKQAELHKKHRTHPTLTLIAPLAIHIPVLILMSLTIRTSLEIPLSPLYTEPFLWMANLSDPDLEVLPFLGGALAFGNAEMAARKAKAVEAARAAEREAGAEGFEEMIEPPGLARRPSGQTSAPNRPQARSFSTTFVGLAVPPKQPPSSPSHLRGGQAGQSSPPSPPASPKPRPKLSPSAPPRQPSRPAPKPSPRPTHKSTPPPSPASSRPSTAATTKPTARPTPSAGTARAPGAKEEIVEVDGKKKRVVYLNANQVTSIILTYAMRGGAILFIPIATSVPAALALYWSTSMAFTIFQNLLLDFLDARAHPSKAVVEPKQN